MQFIFAQVYVKFYLIQINSSKSYYDFLMQTKAISSLDALMDEEDEMKPENMVFNENEHKEVNVLFKKFFFFKNKIFSKVEVLGLVVETNTMGNDKNERYYITLDDSTARMLCICWKNRNPVIYDNLKSASVSLFEIKYFLLPVINLCLTVVMCNHLLFDLFILFIFNYINFY
jgi:hypothetical protein